MLTERLRRRCPSARPVATAIASNHILEFTKPSLDRSGKATLVAANNQRKLTPGVLFEIEKQDLPSLDKAEGAGQGYDRYDEFEVRLSGTDELVAATTYLASETTSHLKPYDWYLALVIAGANEHALDETHIEMLNQIEYTVDDHFTRLERAEAMRALAAHGYLEPRQVLRR